MYRQLLIILLFLAGVSANAQQLSATIKAPASAKPGEEFTVEISVNKGALSGFMKFFEEVPEGSTATSSESRGGSFSFADNGVKVVWISPPTDAEFTISYKLQITKEGSTSLGGRFSYINDNERKTFDLAPVTISIGNSAVATRKTPEEKPKAEVKETPKTEPVKEEPKAEPVVKEQPKPEVKKDPLPVVTEKPRVPVTATASAGRVYKVQIGAFASKPKFDGVTDLSTLVLDNGITKYFSGNFSTYAQAAKHRDELVKKGFEGAFIVAFENGKQVK